MVSCPDEVMSDDLKPAEPIIFVSADLDEELLAVAYIRMKVEGLLPIVYHESIPPLSEFIAYHNKEKKHSYYDHYLGAFARPTLDAPPELIGMGWLGGIRGPVGSIKGEVGFVFFHILASRAIQNDKTEQCGQYQANKQGYINMQTS